MAIQLRVHHLRQDSVVGFWGCFRAELAAENEKVWAGMRRAANAAAKEAEKVAPSHAPSPRTRCPPRTIDICGGLRSRLTAWRRAVATFEGGRRGGVF